MYKQVIELIKGKKTFLIASHINPDGDGIGSTLALGEALAKMGKSVVMYNRDSVPKNLCFLSGSSKIVNKIPEGCFDAIILADCASLSRAGIEPSQVQGIKVVIDHHQYEDSQVDLTCIDQSAASTGEVLLKLLQMMDSTVTPETALCIYCSLVVDTGFFRFSNTTEHTLRLAADLVAWGADPWLVAKNLEEMFPVSRLRLLAKSLATLEVAIGGRYASMDITQAMLSDTGADIQLSEDFASIPRTIDTVEVSALFREVSKNKTKASLRSKSDIDVALIAQKFGGGGHTHAAGCVLKSNINEAKDKIRLAVEKAFNN